MTSAPIAPLRVLGYVRLSEETETTTSPERQRQVIRDFCRLRGFVLVDIEEDLDVSASHSRLDRPGLKRIGARVAAGEADLVVVWRLDRLARKVLDTLTLIDEWAKHDCGLASATEGIDLSSSIGKAMATLVAVFAEMEADAIRVRVTGSIDHLRKVGRFSGGRVPFGLTTAPNPEGPGVVLVADPDEVTILDEVARRLIQGEGLASISRDLNRREVPASTSPYRTALRRGESTDGKGRGKWTSHVLRELMTSDVLNGHRVHRGKVLADADGVPRVMGPALLPRDVVDSVAEVLGGKVKPQRKRKRARLLSGLLACAECGANLHIASSRGRVSYRCMTKSTGGVCSGPTVSADAIEAHVIAEMLDARGDLRITETVAAGDDAALVDLKAERAAVASALTAAKVAYTEAADDDEEDAAAVRVSTLKRRLRDLDAEVFARPVLYVIRDTGRTWSDEWADAVARDAEATAIDASKAEDPEDGAVIREVVAARQSVLSEAVTRVLVTRTDATSRKFDPSRFSIEWTVDDVMAQEVPTAS